jgi:hypothetical protein
MAPHGKPMSHLGSTKGGDSSGLLGRIQGRAGIRPKGKKKKEKPFRFSNPFYNFKPIFFQIKFKPSHGSYSQNKI